MERPEDAILCAQNLKKTTGQLTAAVKTVCAMLNRIGGIVVFGVTDKGKIMEIVNPDAHQFGITPEKLAQPHESKPWNPIIANVFYRAGIIERWGMGTLNIIDWCAENGNPIPAWHEQAGSLYVTFHPAALPAAQRGAEQVTTEDAPEVTHEVTPEVAGEVTGEVAGEVTGEVADEVCRLLQILDLRPLTRSQAQLTLGLKGQANFRDRYLTPALAAGLIEMTIPDKPRSSKQKYRLTDKGKKWLADSLALPPEP